MNKLSRRRSPIGWSRDPGERFVSVIPFHPDPDHIHVMRMRRGLDGWSDWAPRIENPLKILKDAGVVVTDSKQAVIGPGCVKMDLDEQHALYGSSFPTVPPLTGGPPEDVYVVFGKADIVAKVRDSFNRDYPQNDIHHLGVYSIGYSIHDDWQGGELVVEPYTRAFEGEIRDMEDDGVTRAVYRATDQFPSVNDSVWYAVSNYHPLLGWANWTAGAADGCWNTRMVDAGLPWIAQDTTQDVDPGKPGYPKFPDGVYKVTVHASDLINEEIQEHIPVIVDNFAPFVKEVRIWRRYEVWTPEGLEEDEGTAVIYHARWEFRSDGACVKKILYQEASPDANLHISVEFSEPMNREVEPEITANHEGGSVSYGSSGDWESPTQWEGAIWGSENKARFGEYAISITAEDLAGNALHMNVSVMASREANGEWSEGYVPGADENHSFIVAPALWVVERHSNDIYRLAGYRKDGTPDGSDPGDPPVRFDFSAWAIGSVHCSSDPVDGGCWIYGDGAGLGKVSAGGELLVLLDTSPGSAMWVGTEHRSAPWVAKEPRNEACWIIKDVGSAVRIKRYAREEEGWNALPAVVLPGYDSYYFPLRASIDQRTGDVWVVMDDWEWGNPLWGRLVRMGVIEEEGEERIGCRMSTRLKSEYCVRAGVSASPQDGSAWVAEVGGLLSEEFMVRKYSSSGDASDSVVFCEGSSHYSSDYVKSSPAVCSFPRSKGCTTVWIASQEINTDPPPASSLPQASIPSLRGYEFVSFDTMVVVTGAGNAGHQIKIAGCTTNCEDEYVNDFFLSANPKLGGIWWVRPHMVPPGGPNCSNSSSPRDYVMDFHLLRPGGRWEHSLFSKTFPGCGPVGHFDELADLGVCSISACAGALWDEWPAEAQYVGVTPQGAALSITPVLEPKPFVYHLGPIYPNPCRGCKGAIIDYGIGGGGGRVRLEIYDLNGRIIRRVVNGTAIPGAYKSEWDLFDDRGMRVPSATYVVQLLSEGHIARQKYVVLR